MFLLFLVVLFPFVVVLLPFVVVLFPFVVVFFPFVDVLFWKAKYNVTSFTMESLFIFLAFCNLIETYLFFSADSRVFCCGENSSGQTGIRGRE